MVVWAAPFPWFRTSIRCDSVRAASLVVLSSEDLSHPRQPMECLVVHDYPSYDIDGGYHHASHDHLLQGPPSISCCVTLVSAQQPKCSKTSSLVFSVRDPSISCTSASTTRGVLAMCILRCSLWSNLASTDVCDVSGCKLRFSIWILGVCCCCRSDAGS